MPSRPGTARRYTFWLVLLAAAPIVWLAGPHSLRDRIAPIAYAATINVTNTNDSGPGSLREAILTSNQTAGPNVINFNIPGTGAVAIAPLSPLPTITTPMSFRFTSGSALPIELVGFDAGTNADGLVIAAGNSTIGGITITGFGGAGIKLITKGNNTIEGPRIGVDPSGHQARGNGMGISVEAGSNDNVIGQVLVSGNNGPGIRLASTGNRVSSSIIGLDNDRNPLGNLGDGVLVQAGSNDVSANRIDGNQGNGVRVERGVGSSISINELAGNSANGVQVDTAASGIFLLNYCFANGGICIDLGGDGVTPNDLGDTDTGANNLQNFPVITSVVRSTADALFGTATGTLNSTPNTTFKLNFFRSNKCGPSGHGESPVGSGSGSVTTDSNGNANFSFSVVTDPASFIVVTAEDPSHNTSEFSPCVQTNSPGFLGFSSLDFGVNESAGNATVTVARTAGSIGPVSVNYTTSDGTAHAGVDYAPVSGTLNFADGETSRTFSVPINDNLLTDGTRSLNVNLSGATNGSALGVSRARIVILDDESPAAPNLVALVLHSASFSSTQSLETFNSEVPGQVLSSVPISGLQPNELLSGIDFRPLNGKLYGIGRSRLYTIDTSTGVATAIGNGPFLPAINQFTTGFSFDPVTDRIRLTTRQITAVQGVNLQLNPDTGKVVAFDTPLSFASSPPPNADPAPAVVSLANTNKFAGAASTTTYAINFRGDAGSSIALETLGSIDGNPVSPSTGQLFNVRLLEPAGYLFGGFDIADNGRGFAIISPLDSPGPLLLKLFPDGGSESDLVGIDDLIMDIASVPTQRLQFSSGLYSVNENAGVATITVKRNGGSSGPLIVNYATSDGTAQAGSDYSATTGALSFGDGETSKTFTVPLLDDAAIEGVESVNLTLSNPGSGAVIGPRSAATIAIMDEPTEAGTTPIDNADFFVRQHYADFLSRTPDSGGLVFWTNHITECFNDAACINDRRVGTSAAFFTANEFQQTGFFIYRFYQAALGRRPMFAEFTADRGQVVGGANLENGKQTFATEFVQRGAFLQQYLLTMDGPTFVDAVINTASVASGVDLSSRRAALLVEYNDGANQTDSRVRVMRMLVDDSAFSAALYNPAFVLMQYFGYLRRPPDQNGYNFWLDHLNNRNPNNYRAMVCAFITSHEYQRRFSTIITRSNQDCAP